MFIVAAYVSPHPSRKQANEAVEVGSRVQTNHLAELKTAVRGDRTTTLETF